MRSKTPTWLAHHEKVLGPTKRTDALHKVLKSSKTDPLKTFLFFNEEKKELALVLSSVTI